MTSPLSVRPAGLPSSPVAPGPLSCPACGKLIPILGRRKSARHPIAEWLRERSFSITGWWCLFLLISFVIGMLIPGGTLLGRAMGFWFFFFPALPGFLLYFVVRFFPRYRVTQCPYCGHEELRRLGGRKHGEALVR